MVSSSLSKRPIRLLLCLLSVNLATAVVKVQVRVEPESLGQTLNSTMKFTVSCVAKEESRRYRRYGQDNSRILTRLRILVETGVHNKWQPLVQISNLDPSHVFVDPAFPEVRSVGTISQHLQYRDSGLSAVWTGPTIGAIKQFRCDAITFDREYSGSGTYHWGDTRIKTTNLNSNSLAHLSALEKDSSIKKLDLASAEIDGENPAVVRNKAITEDRAEIGEILKRLKLRLEEAKRMQTEKIEKMTQILNDLLSQALENQTRELINVESTLDTALEGSFLMLWPVGTYALPKPSTGCPSTSGRYWEDGYRRHHTESIQRNEDELSPDNHLQQPVLHRKGDKFFVYQRFCVKTEGNTFGPAWPKGSYCINAVSRCPGGFQMGYVTLDEEDFRSEATTSGILPKGKFEKSKTTYQYCCREDGRADEPVDMPRFQPFYLYRYRGKCQQVVGMNVTEEFIHFDTENSNNGDSAESQHPDVELDDLVLHLCFYEHF